MKTIGDMMVRHIRVILLMVMFLSAGQLSFAENKPFAWNALYRAAQTRRVEVVERMIAKGTDANIENEEGVRPLYWTAKKGDKTIVELLLRAGADINSSGALGTPLHAAADEGHVDVVEFLLARGADVNVRGESQKTPLHFAVFNDRGATAEFLIAHGADVNAADSYGNTPLHWAVGGGQTAMVSLLISKGADVNAKNILGETPLASIRDGDKKDIRALLGNNQAK